MARQKELTNVPDPASEWQARAWLRWLPLILLGLTLLALFHRLLLGEVLFWGLPSLQFYPWREFATSELMQGRLPLWNPYNGAGAPLLANYQSAVFYPPNLLHLLLPGPQWMGILSALHLFWAGLGMWLLAGRLRIPPLGRGVATLAFPLSSTLVARLGTLPMIDAAAWLPWLILAVDCLITTPKSRDLFWPSLGLAAVVAMQLLAGHAQWAFYSLALAGSYILWRIVAERRTPRRAFSRLVLALLAVALGISIAAAQLLPTLELQRHSQRSNGVSEAFALNFSFSPFSLVTLFYPDFFGNPGDGSYVIGGAYFEIAAYIGIVPVTLALLGAGNYWFRRRGRPQPASGDPPRHLTGFYSLAALVTLLLAFGQYNPLYPLLYRHVPTFNLFQAPARWLLLTVFSLAMLAALTTTTLRPSRRMRRLTRIAIVAAAGFAAAGGVGLLVLPDLPDIAMQIGQGIIGLGAVLLLAALVLALGPGRDTASRSQWSVAVLLLLAVDLWWANARSNPTLPADFYAALPQRASQGRAFWPEAAFEQAIYQEYLRFDDYRIAAARWEEYRRSGLPNLNLLDRQPALNNFDPLRPDWFERWMRIMNDPAAQANAMIAAAIGTRKNNSGGADNPVSLTDIPPRVWMVPQAVFASGPEAAEQEIRAEDWDARQTVIIEADMRPIPASTDAGTAVLAQETPLDLTIEVRSPDGGWLVVADAYYPGWEATLGAEPVPIYRANVAFRAVSIPPGEHVVRMTYRPASFRAGAAVSMVSLGMFAALLAVAVMRRRLPGATPAGQ